MTDVGQEPVVKKLQEFVEKYLCFYSDRQLIVSPLSFLKGKAYELIHARVFMLACF